MPRTEIAIGSSSPKLCQYITRIDDVYTGQTYVEGFRGVPCREPLRGHGRHKYCTQHSERARQELRAKKNAEYVRAWRDRRADMPKQLDLFKGAKKKYITENIEHGQ